MPLDKIVFVASLKDGKNVHQEIQQYSKGFLYGSIIFLSLVIIVYLLFDKEPREDRASFVEERISSAIDDFKDGASKVIDTFFPVRTNLREGQTLQTVDDIRLDEEKETTQETSISKNYFSEILKDRHIRIVLLKAILAVLLAYLVVNYILRK